MATTLTHLSDFPDRISPMLVKELRQGMRARVFIILFLAIQFFLAATLLSTSLSNNAENAGTMISTVIFVVFSAAALVIQPLRGTTALSSEIKGNTIDMMVLTRLSSWRIVTGKWVALVSQTALLLTTIIPYLILRYFFGGMDLVQELVAIVLVFVASMALTAVTVGLSGCNSVIIRALVPILGLPMLVGSIVINLAMAAVRGAMFSGGFGIGTNETLIAIGTITGISLYVGASMLSLGASLIAPPAENHARTRRIVALVLLLACIPLGRFGTIDDELLALIIGSIAVPAILIALTDNAPLVSTVCEPFVRRRCRFLGWFLYPTRASGILAALVLCGTALIALVSSDAFRGLSGFTIDDDAIGLLASAGSLLFPAAWLALFGCKQRQLLTPYLLTLVLSILVSTFFAIIADVTNSGAFLWLFAIHPLSFLSMTEGSGVSDEAAFVGVCLCNLMLIVILLRYALKEIAASRPVIAQAEQTLAANR
jgi:ABC-type transport system involved in multi-copper enzyme maturation permease subunit